MLSPSPASLPPSAANYFIISHPRCTPPLTRHPHSEIHQRHQQNQSWTLYTTFKRENICKIMNYSPTFWVFCQKYVDISVNRNNETVLFKRRYKKCFLSRFTDKHVTNVQVIIRCSFITGRYEHTSSLLQPAVMRWTGGAWPTVSGARPPPPPAPRPPVSFITAAYEKRYSEVISVKLGTSQVFCHP